MLQQLAVVKVLFEADTVNAHKTDTERNSPLLWASLEGRLDVVRFLIENGAQVMIDQRAANGINPLVAALINGHQTTAQLLVDNGATWNIEVDEFPNMRDWAAHESFWEALEFILGQLNMEQRGVSALKTSKETAVIHLMPSGFRNKAVRNLAAEQRGGVVLCQLGPDGTEVEITNETVTSLFDENCLIQLYTVDGKGSEPKRYDHGSADVKYRLIKLISRQLGENSICAARS